MTTLKTSIIALISTLALTLISVNMNAQLHVLKEEKNNEGKITVPRGTVKTGRFLRVGDGTGADAKLQIGIGRTIGGNAIVEVYGVSGAAAPTAKLLANEHGVSTFTHDGAGRFQIKTQSASDIHFMTSGNYTRAIITKDGNFGINTVEPTAKLEVNGNAKKNGGGEWSTTSDKRTKKNINQYEAGLADVLKLNPVTFNYNGKAGITDTEKNHVGLIAQEFAEVAPYAVDKFNFKEEGSNKTEEYMSIDASSVKYMLVNGMKEQQALIEAQKAALETLQTEVAELKANGASISTPGASEMSVLLEGSGTESALLAQNSPNPFTTQTRIEYFIPSDSRHCRMSFRDMNGKEIKQVNIEHDGIGAIELSAKDLAAGIYSYLLYVNGDIVASKKMILGQQ